MNYKTIQEPAEALYEISRSEFYSFIFPIQSEAQAQDHVARLRKAHWEARHCCYAYSIGEHASLQKADDDGEPSGTAGKPILEVIKKQELHDTLIIVVRYFGGIKLGAGGLIRAYGKSAALAIDAASIVMKTDFVEVKATLAYSLLGALENYLHQKEILIDSKEYTDQVSLLLLLPENNADKIQNELTDLTGAQCRLEVLGKKSLNIPIK